MNANPRRVSGRHFLQIPGPTPVPDRILRAMDAPVIDHRGPEFQRLARDVLHRIKDIFQTKDHVFIYPASGTGAWEAALSNVLSPGDEVLMFETGQFATLWKRMATNLRLEVDFIQSDWQRGADHEQIEAKLREDKRHSIKAVCIVHNETSTGCVSPISKIRQALTNARHPALLLVDAISSLASAEFLHDEWSVDVTVAGSQKGLMLPPGLAFTAVSKKAMEVGRKNLSPSAYWSWHEMEGYNREGFFPYTPATNLLYGLKTAIDMLEEEGLPNVFARHNRHAEAARRATRGWGLEVNCKVPEHYSATLTAVRVPEDSSADALRRVALDHFDMSLGTGLGRLADKVFRIGHLGDTNDLTIVGALAGIEMSLEIARIPHTKGGVAAAMKYLCETSQSR